MHPSSVVSKVLMKYGNMTSLSTVLCAALMKQDISECSDTGYCFEHVMDFAVKNAILTIIETQQIAQNASSLFGFQLKQDQSNS